MDSMLEWSRAAWRRHLPAMVDIDLFIRRCGDGTIHGLAHESAVASPDRLAVHIGDQQITHGQLDALAARFATRFAPGDRVVLAAPVSLAWIGAYVGILRAGGVAVLANPTFTASELDQIVNVAEAALVLTELRVPDVEPEPWTERVSSDSTAVLAFTSGTTGKPKGVPLTHRNLLTSIRVATHAWRWSPEDLLIHAMPLYHQHGLGGLHATLIEGSSLRLLPRFDPDQLVAEIERWQPSVLFAVPTMYQRLGGKARNSLRLCISGSAPLSPAVADNARQVLGLAPLVRYGTTGGGLATSQIYEQPLPDTVGVPLPGVELRLGTDGEIQLRGPQVAAAFLERDGWFRTGDIGMLDEATGQLVIDGRIKEMIITGGMKVYPREVEVALESHPDVAEAAVAGVASERWGEQVTAWVVLKAGATFDADKLIEHAGTLLAPYKRPKEIKRLESLPRNHVGKIDRRELR